ncbi:hypothetical protein DY000_02008346, partial [Brassica cretica]
MEWVDEDLQRIGKEMVQKCGGLPLAIVVLTGLMSEEEGKRVESCVCHVFPEDYETEVEQLIHIFVAERFIQEDEGMMMEDVAQYFIEELIDRSLGGSSEKRERESNWATFFYYVVEGKWFHYLINSNDLCDRRVNKRMRSFLFFGEKGMLGGFVQTITLNLRLLRVLNLGGLLFLCKGYVPLSLPDAIGDLIHLRYLGIADAGRKNLPTFISNLQFLQTLDASGSNYFKGTTDLNLEIYLLLQLDHELLINLKDVEIYGRPTRVGERNISVPLNLASFSKLKNLLVLKLEVNAVEISTESEEDVIFFPSLESLTLDETTLEEEPMPALQKLPRLEDLVLKECEWLGAKMSISEQGFCRLRKLELITVRLNELEIEEKSMPSLLKLNLEIERGATKLLIPDRLQAFVQ